MNIHQARWSGGGDVDPPPAEISGQRVRSPARQVLVVPLVGLLALTAAVTLAPAVAAQSTATARAAVSTGSMDVRAATLQAWPVLRQGSNSTWPRVTVRSLQYLLNAHGATLQVDGIFGARTDAAVRAFQHTHGLVVDGIVGQKTWSAVIVTVRRGSVGAAVKAVQDQANFRNLRGDGPPTLQVDGVFGPKTEAWVRGFQTGMSLQMPFAVDGIVGPMTWRALVTEALSG